jgi:VanZ family protein
LQKNLLRKTYFTLLAAIGWFITSIVLLTLPGTAFPQEDWLDKVWFDKWVHIGMFALLVLLWCLAIRSLKKDIFSRKLIRVFSIIAIIFLGYGIGMEFIQKNFIPYRSFDSGDIIADAVGCAAGLIFSVKRYIKK